MTRTTKKKLYRIKDLDTDKYLSGINGGWGSLGVNNAWSVEGITFPKHKLGVTIRAAARAYAGYRWRLENGWLDENAVDYAPRMKAFEEWLGKNIFVPPTWILEEALVRFETGKSMSAKDWTDDSDL